ncbi:MAG: DUF2946 family protein, partial [Burkholderiaceae bacterium]|nr:DUF2946 family protein [Burkholderiaceae bacterium]
MSAFLSSRLRKTLAWLALCAMCFGAAAPTISRWLAATAQAADLVAICDGRGLELVPAPQVQAQIQQTQQTQARGRGQPQQDQRHGGSGGGSSDGDCCSFCALLHHWPGAPAMAVDFAPPVPLPAAHGVT